MSLKRYQAIATNESLEYLDIDLEKFQLSEQEAMQDPKVAKQIQLDEQMASRMRREPQKEMQWTKEQVKGILKD